MRLLRWLLSRVLAWDFTVPTIESKRQAWR